MAAESVSRVYFIQASGAEEEARVAEKAEAVYRALDLDPVIEKNDLVAVKVHFGEKGNTGYIRPSWIRPLLQRIKKSTSRVFLTDTNTLYVGHRSNSVDHLSLAHEHGFSIERVGVPVVIADGLIGRDSEEVRVDLPHVKTAKIASAIMSADVLVVLSHFTGHVISGFGATIKNLGMGCASRAGKLEQHSDVHPWITPKACRNCSICLEYCPSEALEQEEDHVRILDERCIGCGECLVVCPYEAVKMRWDSDAGRVQEKMAEYAFAVVQRLDRRAGFLNFLIRITRDCDCMSKSGTLIADDLGILGSKDPVAVDKAAVDLLMEKNGKDFLKAAHEVDWSVQLEHAERIGLGNTDYELISLD